MNRILPLAAFLAIGVAAPTLADHEPGHPATPPDRVLGGPGKLFKETDTNSDGAISKEEFLAFYEKRFVELDANGDGSFTKEEAQARAAEFHEKMKEKLREREAKKKAAEPSPKDTPDTTDETKGE